MPQIPLITWFLSEILNKHNLISISGESGTGKTTLGLQIAGFMLTKDAPYKNQCIWIQASESFPKQRLASLYSGNKQQLVYLQKNILVFPKEGHFSSYESQRYALTTFSTRIFPPELKIIIIDNISHHLRYWLMQQEDIGLRNKILDDFYSIQLFPLIMRCQREGIWLVLLHEVSYKVREQVVRPFFSQLYDRLDLLNIALSKSFETQLKTLEIKDGIDSMSQMRWVYELTQNGILLLQ